MNRRAGPCAVITGDGIGSDRATTGAGVLASPHAGARRERRNRVSVLRAEARIAGMPTRTRNLRESP